jgi:CBS domain containing-hemolysin-like protein
MITSSHLVFTLVLCTMAQAFFVGAEIAISTATRQRPAGDARPHWTARLADKLASRPQITLSTTLIGAKAATVIAVAITALYLAQTGGHPMFAVAMVVPAMLVLGQLVPKTLMQIHADRVVLVVAPFLWLWSWLLRPAVLVVAGFAAAMTRLAGTDRKKAFVTRDELSIMIETEPETDKPQITSEQREMIANVFELSEYSVRDLMVPLSEVTALPEDTSLGEAAREVADKQHSRMPVYRSRVDDVVGVVHVFDLLQAGTGGAAAAPPSRSSGGSASAVAGGENATVASVMKPPTYVPETMKAADLLVELQAEGQHLAIVVDEYGGAVGIVTVEDLLETIVGDIDDEYDREPSPIRAEKPGVWRAAAKTPVARINSELDLDLPESDDYETVAGLLIDRLRHIPDAGESLAVGNAVIEVIAASGRAIEAVRITKRKK